MPSKMKKNLSFAFMMIFGVMIVLAGCSDGEKSEAATDNDQASGVDNSSTAAAEKKNNDKLMDKAEEMKNNIKLSASRGFIGDEVEFTIDQLPKNADVQLVWPTVDGSYAIENEYEVIGPEFVTEDVVILEGKSDADGKWADSFTIPEGFGGDYTVYVATDNKKIGQTAYTVDPTFKMTPESGPVGTEITIEVEGLGHSTYMRNWQLTYDNKYTGLVSAIATNGKAEAKIRAAGNPGDHAIRLRTGYLGMQYINYLQSPYPDKPAPDFMFTITDEPFIGESHVEDAPVAANGGVEMPELKNDSGVTMTLDTEIGAVGDPVTMTAEGLDKDKEVELVWNTMKGSRVSGLGFAEESSVLDTIKTDGDGAFTYDFKIPDDLGGIPHRIDAKIGDKVVGQTYLSIKPTLVSISPTSGPVGTKIEVTIKGGGWTEFDNAYYLTYDNAYTGYLCSFNSQGTLTFDVIATGDVGYHVIDMYPGLYRQKEKDTDMTLIPQLTYSTDHPGSAMPAIRLGFEVTE
ncbi:hypothetical protein H9649_10220 [Sporosarcina sp. Sa2YVA2]|uniref:Bacterial Ig-like domain-containing protein n=1 Tax=Sporosarcina quadrami TaxID=2762234 RepID=A0ABR8UAC7_9BACL|nr:IPT/TIG domain-containing protein [Sporosarcina quadrami]MBD7984961.1 hypothetical protein [Sporosarcina quadrami]